MSWAEEKTLEKFISENSYNPSLRSVIGLFPRNLSLKSVTFSGNGEGIEITGHGFLFTGSVTGAAEIDTSINGESSTITMTVTNTFNIDNGDRIYTTSASGSRSRLGKINISHTSPSYNTELLYISPILSSEDSLNGRTLNGPIEFKERIEVRCSHIIRNSGGDTYVKAASSMGSFTYILETEGGGRNVKTQFQNFPGWDFCENVCRFLSRNLKERRCAA